MLFMFTNLESVFIIIRDIFIVLAILLFIYIVLRITLYFYIKRNREALNQTEQRDMMENDSDQRK